MLVNLFTSSRHCKKGKWYFCCRDKVAEITDEPVWSHAGKFSKVILFCEFKQTVRTPTKVYLFSEQNSVFFHLFVGFWWFEGFVWFGGFCLKWGKKVFCLSMVSMKSLHKFMSCVGYILVRWGFFKFCIADFLIWA